MKIRSGVTGDATGSQERERSAREHDGSGDHRTPRSIGETTAGGRRGDQREAQYRDGENGEHHPHHPVRNRLVHDARCREDAADHQDNDADALGPGCPAEKQPPHEHRQSAGEPAKDRGATGSGHDEGDDKPDRQQQHRGDHAGPQPKRFPRSQFVDLHDTHEPDQTLLTIRSFRIEAEYEKQSNATT